MEGSLKEKAGGESGDDEKIERSIPINLNSLPATASMAAAAPEDGGLHSAVESGAKDSSSTKGVESIVFGPKKIPKNEVVDDDDVQACDDAKSDSVVPLDSKNPFNEKDALANVAENGQSADCRPEDQRVKVLNVVKKDESADDVSDSINPVTVAGIGGVENLKLICGTVHAEWKGGEEKESKISEYEKELEDIRDMSREECKK
ncbi:hypothetical protein E2562_013770 [Oryza meyeriana var. granulata]|uniref:Uncharacterized protein n=1 Tax=Oryza meyeriana var. granulata TaxID=110450 RepID=A0A6G1F882_9ORYZ|nr:hypothetical protein E2562_013770 [Oryza meyeriana var. granulata]